MESGDCKALETVLGSNRARLFSLLKDDESKQIVKTVFRYITETFYASNPSYNYGYDTALDLGASNKEIERFQSNIEKLDLEKLKITLDLDGFADVPDDWFELARFLVRAERGKAYECRKSLSNLAKMIVFKISGHAGDKDFLRTFHNVPARQLLAFFKKYRVEDRSKPSKDDKEIMNGILEKEEGKEDLD